MNTPLFIGGKPVLEYMRCKGTPQVYLPYITRTQTTAEILGVASVASGDDWPRPPFRAKADGAYNLGDFILGMPFIPSKLTWQYDNLTTFAPVVDDIIEMVVVPQDHFADAIRFDIVGADAHMAGATVQIAGLEITMDANGDYTYAESAYVTAAVTAQMTTPIIPLNTASSNTVFLTQVTDGYMIPLYSGPSKAIAIGLKIVSMPTDNTLTIADMANAAYMSVRLHAFDCPAYL